MQIDPSLPDSKDRRVKMSENVLMKKLRKILNVRNLNEIRCECHRFVDETFRDDSIHLK